MTPTEHEGTVAVDAAARKFVEDHYSDVTFDDLEPLVANGFREMVLPFVWAALEALPDRRAAAWDEGWKAGADDQKKWSDMSVPDEVACDTTENPYKES